MRQGGMGWKTSAALALAAVLAGCGGGSGNSASNSTSNGGSSTPAAAPVATTTPPSAGSTGTAPDTAETTVTAHPSCAAGSPYTLIVKNGGAIDPAVLEKMECEFFLNYPKIVARLNPVAAPTTVRFTFGTIPNPAWTIDDEVTFSTTYMRNFPQDIDVVTHEIVHVAQHAPDLPGWVVEGTADFLRQQYGLYNVSGGWTMVEAWAPNQNYTDGYGTAASFFKWIDYKYREGKLPIVDALQAAGMHGPYDPQIWVTLTGYDLDTLWYLYSNKTLPAPPGAKCAPGTYPC